MQTDNVRELKIQLRRGYRDKRLQLSAEEKQWRDDAIALNVQRLWQYRQSDTLLTYVSTPSEVDTVQIMQQAWVDGKRVAVPYCIPDTREMEFYIIHSLDELHDGAFGVREPMPSEARQLTDLSKGLCLVPAFCYDRHGYRLGYGKGYYDRFLARFGGYRVGLCYRDCIRHTLPHGRFDCTVDTIVTEQRIQKTE